MLSFQEKTSSIMGNGLNSDEKTEDEEYGEDGLFKKVLQFGGFNKKKTNNGLIFFAGTDKARVITEILEERGWSRTKDHKVTNYTIKWCLAHQVDWSQFQEGKQLINNIPGQLTFADKINLWYTIGDYLRNRRTIDGNHIQTFLPMTFVLDNENEITEFLRSYKKQNRIWICKPRYSYAGRGIYIITAQSDLNAIFKFKIGNNNHHQHQPKLPGYLMQEYISRPLLLKGRKFDIRVHWLVAWTKPLLVFYNHNASVVRLSLNLYREFDFDRATHLTNLSVQENHYRYAFSHEATGMTMSQLNHYFNQCFRPFHPKLCQDWVMTVMQERMQTIIRHVMRASKDKLARSAGHFGLFGCDFLLDENFRIWLLEINDNPGVGWGNSRLNTMTKPLFEETLNIVFECFEKYQKGQPLVPIECLKNYQLMYNEADDEEKCFQDDNQIYTDRLSIRYATKLSPSRTSFHRGLQRVKTSRTSKQQNDANCNVFPQINLSNSSPSVNDILPLNASINNIIPLNSPVDNVTPLNSSESDVLLLNSDIIDIENLNLPTISVPLINLTRVCASSLTSPTVETNVESIETIESLRHDDDDIQLQRLVQPIKLGQISKNQSFSQQSSSTNRSPIKTNKTPTQRTLSTVNNCATQRKSRADLRSVLIEHRRYSHRSVVVPSCTETTKKLNQFSPKRFPYNNENEKQDNKLIKKLETNNNLPELYPFN